MFNKWFFNLIELDFTSKKETERKKVSTRKVLGGSVGAIIILVIAQLLAHMIESVVVVAKVPEGICNMIKGFLYLLFAYILLKFLAAKILKMKFEVLGIPKFRIDVKWVIAGILLPTIVTAIFLLLPGQFVSSEMNGMQMFATLSTGLFFSGIAVGFVEEFVFRGFILNLLHIRWNRTIAIIVPSFLFGALHIIGMDYSILSCCLVLIAGTLAGIMFSYIALENNSVWNSGIVHAIWNFIIIGGGIKISEKPDNYSIITYVLDSKHFAITGGEFGIESSIIAVCGYALVILLTILMIKKKKDRC